MSGGTLVLGKKYDTRVIGLEIEKPLVDYAKKLADEAGLNGQVKFRHVSPGEFYVADESIDFLYASAVLIHFEDKLSVFSQAYRLLKPGGMVLGYDWLRGEDVTGIPLQEWQDASGLTAFPETLSFYTDLLNAAGFEDINARDASDWYRRRAQEEYQQITGPLFEKMGQLGGTEKRDEFINEWHAMLKALDSGELKSGYFRARKPC